VTKALGYTLATQVFAEPATAGVDFYSSAPKIAGQNFFWPFRPPRWSAVMPTANMLNMLKT
jgi:hypothetical protein